MYDDKKRDVYCLLCTALYATGRHEGRGVESRSPEAKLIRVPSLRSALVYRTCIRWASIGRVKSESEIKRSPSHGRGRRGRERSVEIGPLLPGPGDDGDTGA